MNTETENARLNIRPQHPLITDDDAMQAFRAASRIISESFTEVTNVEVTWSASPQFRSQQLTIEFDGSGKSTKVFGRWTICFCFQVWNPPEREEENMIRLSWRTFPPQKNDDTAKVM